MEKDFHYNLIFSIAQMTEFDNADTIAYASQFVDDNNEGCFEIDGHREGFPEKIKMNGGNYYPIMTQSLSPKSLDSYVQKYVYTPFHFLPGDNTVEIDGRKNPLNTTPDSAAARTIVKEAVKSDNPYRIGIAMHTYADTWSHQNFTGLRESWNSVYPWYKIFKSMVPNIGHAEAGHAPDIISDTWTDHRFRTKVRNRVRAFEAVREIYKALRSRSQKGPRWSEVRKDFRFIIHASDYDDRRERINDFLKDNAKNTVPKYSENRWIDDALDRSKGKIVLKQNFTKTHWHHFHQAAKIQFARVLDLVKEL